MNEVKSLQWKERLSFIEMVAGIRDRWGAYRQTLEGYSDWVNAVAFSPGGSTIRRLRMIKPSSKYHIY